MYDNLGLESESIGFRLKMLRLSKGLTAKAVANALGVSPAYISMLERGKSNYNLTLLLKLMDVYGETLSDFLKSPKTGDRIRRLSDIQPFTEDEGKLQYWLIRNANDPNIFRPYHFHLEPGGSTGISEPHSGTEFIYALEGESTVFLTDPDSGESTRYVLNASDSMYYSSNDFHCVRNETKKPSSFLLIYSPYLDDGGDIHVSDHLRPVSKQ